MMMEKIRQYAGRINVAQVFAISAISLSSLVLVTYPLIEHSMKGPVVKELAPLVEFADGKPGISLEDKMDFAQRAGLLPNTFDLEKFSYLELKKALESYKKGE